MTNPPVQEKTHILKYTDMFKSERKKKKGKKNYNVSQTISMCTPF